MSGARGKLKVVKTEQPPPFDIYAADKAKIAATDWAGLHVRSDRSRPIDIPDRRQRPVMGFGIRVEKGREP